MKNRREGGKCWWCGKHLLVHSSRELIGSDGLPRCFVPSVVQTTNVFLPAHIIRIDNEF